MSETDQPETVSEVCDAAADFIETHGWHQGNYVAGDVLVGSWEPGMGVCAEGGIFGACGMLGVGVTALEVRQTKSAMAASTAVSDHVSKNGDLPGWNDHPSRTQAEVVQALRDTATKHRDDAMRQSGATS